MTTTNINTMAKDQVEAIIKAKGSKFSTVSFIKADGSIRVINGLFKPTSKMVGSDRGMAQGEAMKVRGQVAIWEVAQAKWKSFYADKVISVT
jgi:hypothetical protein